MRSVRARVTGLLVLLSGLWCGACSKEQPRVTVYCALDRGYAEPILKVFQDQTGIVVDWDFDNESSKTVGLVKRIEEEANRPRCDVFWNNEVMHTIRLKRQGLLETYRSPQAASFPAEFRDPDGTWCGFAARARVFILNTRLLPDPAQWPRSYKDLVDPRFAGKGTMAKPLTGTTLTHAAALFATLGAQPAWAFLDGLFTNDVALASSNGSVMKLVREGERAFGFTDTDDFHVALKDGYPVDVVYPDRGDGELGTLLIPNTVAIVKGAPRREQAEKLVDFLLSELVEKQLAYSDSAQIPLRPQVERPPHVMNLGDVNFMKVDFEKVADAYEAQQKALREKFVH
jgi:iron(III) transport system substrate-binding protein